MIKCSSVWPKDIIDQWHNMMKFDMTFVKIKIHSYLYALISCISLISVYSLCFFSIKLLQILYSGIFWIKSSAS